MNEGFAIFMFSVVMGIWVQYILRMLDIDPFSRLSYTYGRLLWEQRKGPRHIRYVTIFRIFLLIVALSLNGCAAFSWMAGVGNP